MKNYRIYSSKVSVLILCLTIFTCKVSNAQSWTTTGDTVSSTGTVKAADLNIYGTCVKFTGILVDTNTDLLGINKLGKVAPLTGSALNAILYPVAPLHYSPGPCASNTPYWFTQSSIVGPGYATNNCTWVGIGEVGILNFPDAPLSVSNSTSTIQFTVANPSNTPPNDVFTVDKTGNTIISGSGSIANGLTVNTTSSAGLTASFLNTQHNANSAVFVAENMAGWDYNHLTQTNDNGIFWADNYGVGNTASGLVIAPWANAPVGIRIDASGNTSVNGVIIANGNSSLWTTSTGSTYTPATSNTNGGWTVPITIPNGSAIRIASNSNGHYLGFGMVDENTTGWYWMVESTSDNTATACYPMTLLMDVNGNAVLTVSQNGWCDYVFSNTYKPMSIEEKESYYKTYKHLPGIDPESTVHEKGLNITKNMTGMLQNLEEDRLDITKLYDIIKQQQKEIEELKNKLNSMQQQK